MFHSTRLKLTAWYLLIIMLVSLIFSIVIYVSVTRELTRFASFQDLRRERIESDFGNSPLSSIGLAVDAELIREAKGRLISNLILLNICILGGSTLAGYFLAGRTLRPIQDVLDSQVRFIGDAAHELKTPLTSLRTEIEVFFLDTNRTKKDAEEILTSNLEEVVRLQNLTDGLMQLSHYETKKQLSDQFVKIKLQQVISLAIKKMEPQAKTKKISIANLAKNSQIMGDEKSLVQLFVILLDNAIKYSLPGTTITVASAVQDFVSVKMTDQGMGMTPSDLKNVFNRFYRADKSRSSETQGYGLGLSIAHEIVRLHNGQISVQSKELKGSTFTVLLPKVQVKKRKTR